jgi:WD40 repeat protein
MGDKGRYKSGHPAGKARYRAWCRIPEWHSCHLTAPEASRESTVRLWDIADQRQIGQLLTGHPDRTDAIAVTELSGCPVAITAGWDEAVQLWDIPGRRQIGLLSTGHTKGTRGIAVTALDGRPALLTAGRGDGKVRVWDIEKHTQLDEIVMPDMIGDLALSARGTLVVTFGKDFKDFAAFDIPDHSTTSGRAELATNGN